MSLDSDSPSKESPRRSHHVLSRTVFADPDNNRVLGKALTLLCHNDASA